ncbi:hypothetical protein VKT23_011974 [Stygiomarasmius scandens]|uniref:Uncharacterized protein n=1 Tax=Marasmiellus scandens TaxID=2682957 RepID=A0ABR1J7H3_9AGAR
MTLSNRAAMDLASAIDGSGQVNNEESDSDLPVQTQAMSLKKAKSGKKPKSKKRKSKRSQTLDNSDVEEASVDIKPSKRKFRDSAAAPTPLANVQIIQSGGLTNNIAASEESDNSDAQDVQPENQPGSQESKTEDSDTASEESEPCIDLVGDLERDLKFTNGKTPAFSRNKFTAPGTVTLQDLNGKDYEYQPSIYSWDNFDALNSLLRKAIPYQTVSITNDLTISEIEDCQTKIFQIDIAQYNTITDAQLQNIFSHGNIVLRNTPMFPQDYSAPGTSAFTSASIANLSEEIAKGDKGKTLLLTNMHLSTLSTFSPSKLSLDKEAWNQIMNVRLEVVIGSYPHHTMRWATASTKDAVLPFRIDGDGFARCHTIESGALLAFIGVPHDGESYALAFSAVKSFEGLK